MCKKAGKDQRSSENDERCEFVFFVCFALICR